MYYPLFDKYCPEFDTGHLQSGNIIFIQFE